MARRRAPVRQRDKIALQFRNRKAIAMVAGVVAFAVIAVVLILGTVGAPDADLLAVVNGDRITSEDVAKLQARYEACRTSIDPDPALEQLVIEKLLYREAGREPYLPTTDEAAQELQAQLEADGFTLAEFQVELELYGISYNEYLETFRRELAIRNYVDAETQITEQQVRERYEEYQQTPDLLLPPFQEVKEQITLELKQEAVLLLIQALKEEADIQYMQSE